MFFYNYKNYYYKINFLLKKYFADMNFNINNLSDLYTTQWFFTPVIFHFSIKK